MAQPSEGSTYSKVCSLQRKPELFEIFFPFFTGGCEISCRSDGEIFFCSSIISLAQRFFVRDDKQSLCDKHKVDLDERRCASESEYVISNDIIYFADGLINKKVDVFIIRQGGFGFAERVLKKIADRKFFVCHVVVLLRLVCHVKRVSDLKNVYVRI